MNTRGAPPENDFAAGNSGGGAPEGNGNAVSHGATCDPAKLDDRLTGPAEEFVDDLTTAVKTRCDSISETRARTVALLIYQFDLATANIADRGLLIDDGPNPVLPHARRLSKQIWDHLETLGAFEQNGR